MRANCPALTNPPNHQCSAIPDVCTQPASGIDSSDSSTVDVDGGTIGNEVCVRGRCLTGIDAPTQDGRQVSLFYMSAAWPAVAGTGACAGCPCSSSSR